MGFDKTIGNRFAARGNVAGNHHPTHSSENALTRRLTEFNSRNRFVEYDKNLRSNSTNHRDVAPTNRVKERGRMNAVKVREDSKKVNEPRFSTNPTFDVRVVGNRPTSSNEPQTNWLVDRWIAGVDFRFERAISKRR